MGESSDIEWTDASWNPTRGCTKISPGCKHCYAETFAERFRGVAGHPYERGFDPRIAQDQLGLPLRWKRPRRIFVDSMSDLLHERFPFEYVGAVFGVMAQAPRHTFQLLTKRAERLVRFYEWLSHIGGDGMVPADHLVTTLAANLVDIDQVQRPWPLPNLHVGVSVEDDKHGKPRIDLLRRIPAAVRFLSIEPLLESLGEIDLSGIHWVILGGESGHGARPFDLAWARSIVEQCRLAGVACFVKQLGQRPVDARAFVGQTASAPDGLVRLRHRKGGDPSEWPEDLRVRQFPEVT